MRKKKRQSSFVQGIQSNPGCYSGSFVKKGIKWRHENACLDGWSCPSFVRAVRNMRWVGGCRQKQKHSPWRFTNTSVHSPFSSLYLDTSMILNQHKPVHGSLGGEGGGGGGGHVLSVSIAGGLGVPCHIGADRQFSNPQSSSGEGELSRRARSIYYG